MKQEGAGKTGAGGSEMLKVLGKISHSNRGGHALCKRRRGVVCCNVRRSRIDPVL